MTEVSGSFSADNVTLALFSPLAYGLICLKVNRAKLRPVLAAAFIIGFAASFVAYLAEVILDGAGFFAPKTHLVFTFFIAVALPEETVKLAGLIGLVGENNELRKCGLVVACFIGCGFAASENIVYLQSFGPSAVSARFFTATAFHVYNAIVMARILRGHLIADESLRIVVALLVAVLLHGSYDYLLSSPTLSDGQFVFVLGFAAAAAWQTLRAYPMANQS
jgi:RsiW-degrading membrane proteinase PrsW (M82 family)